MNSRSPFPTPARRAPLAGASLTLALCVTAPLALYAPAAAAQGAAQPAAGTGRIVGRVVDANSGAGVSDVQVRVEGTTLGALSGVDGRFTVTGVPPGPATLQVRRIGFQAKTVSGVAVAAGRAVEQNVTLAPATVQLAAVQVTAAVERGSVSQALDRQRTAVGIVTAITTEQIARSPDADAAQAVQRVSGVTVQEGRSVFVRGLGDRYTTTTLNGARLPSPEPERRVVPLDLFPSGLLQSITTAKTFTPELSGDFSGAQVDIQTREFPAERQLTFSTSVGANDAATGRAVLTAPRLGPEWVAFAGGRRDLPGSVASYGNFQGRLVQQDFNRIINSFRNAWTPRVQNGLPNGGLSASAGGQQPAFGLTVGYLGSLTYGTSQEVRADEQRAQPSIDPGGRVVPFNGPFAGSTGRTSVLWGGLLNLSTLIGTRTRVQLNNTYNRTSDNEARQDEGLAGDINRVVQRSTLRFVERSVRSSQLRTEHSLTDRQTLDWSVTSSGVSRREPDRSDLVYVSDVDPATGARQPFAYLESSQDASRRTFTDLTESGWNFGANYRLRLGGEGARRPEVRVGGLFRTTDRDADNLQYAIVAPSLPSDVRQRSAEQIFGGEYTDQNDAIFRVSPLGVGGSYTARERIGAGYLMAEYPLSSRFRLIAGARVEGANIRVRTQEVDGDVAIGRLENTDVLPSAVLNYQVRENQNLRLAFSQTLARPELRELSPVTVREVLGDFAFTGNANLRRTLIQNADLKWEWFPQAGEVLSVGVFAKNFDGPIERVDQPTSSAPIVTVANAKSAFNYGLEVEARKSLGFVAPFLAPVSGFANGTWMRSEIDISNVGVTAVSNPQRAMVGQAPYVVNTGLTYTRPANNAASATVLYNVVGSRVAIAGLIGFPNVMERPRDLLDVSVRLPLPGRSGAGIRLDARNLLDAPYLLEQGDLVRERYRLGRVYSFGISWRQ
jgi:hypothetical protein